MNKLKQTKLSRVVLEFSSALVTASDHSNSKKTSVTETYCNYLYQDLLLLSYWHFHFSRWKSAALLKLHVGLLLLCRASL